MDQSLKVRVTLLVSSLATGLLIAGAMIGSSGAGLGETVSPLADSLQIFQRASSPSDPLTAAVKSRIASITEAGSASAGNDALGPVDYQTSRLAFASTEASVYLVRTLNGGVCYSITAGPLGCDDARSLRGDAMTIGVFDGDGVGKDEPTAIYGLVLDSVRSVTIRDSAGRSIKADVGDNIFFARMLDATAWPRSVTAERSDRSRVTVAVTAPPSD